ncbi:tryptophan halogenase family protein [Sphingobium sp.]|uniref:tryptophan halogenase family protein n=1 Tax=Sphingobium sp. TaxID=1912891 RepID=UPI003BB7D48E
MSEGGVRNVIIVGGGTAGWMAAAVLARGLARNRVSITVVESSAIGTVGVGEATIPPILKLNALFGLDEDELVRRTQATYKLGIEFRDWRERGHRYFHPFGSVGADLNGVHFHHYWLRTGQGDIADYSLPAAAAQAGRFARPVDDPRNVLSRISYALHFDATLYAALLRETAIANGVTHVEGRITDVHLRSADGFVEHLTLDDGRTIRGDLFIDCSGFRGLLIEDALKTGYEDWSHWLPMDRALAVGSESIEAPHPFTRSTARDAGWMWRIPLQHRVGNGHVYCSQFMNDEDAGAQLLAQLDSKPLGDPRPLRFVTGRRKQAWNRNVVALGLASGFIEPLESTSIHLVQQGVTTLLSLFPADRIDPAEVACYNRMIRNDFESVRDFVILHYKQTLRRDTPFWRHVADMAVPDTLNERMALFAANGRILLEPGELFTETSWVAVMLGQGLVPRGYDPQADLLDEDDVRAKLDRMRGLVTRGAQALPRHMDYIRDHGGSAAAA